ncbi:TetR/AcrR family transcriptional regulator [Microbacterium sp. NPDC056234]|uniref:TetR/AcrR family transcriptional regulator n=1 Tax=Microbacterium sp. NPDC056234 TaxID=3345757 RepID=UPI0035E08C7B
MTGPQSNGHDARRKRTRDALVRNAAQLFAEQGYAATTVTQIVQRAEVSERTFYVHFPAKEDLLFAHVEDFAALAVQVATDTDSADPVVRVRAALLALIAAATGEDDLSRHAGLRAVVASGGSIPRSLAARLMTLASELARRIAEITGAPLAAVAPMVGAAVGAVEAAGLIGGRNGDSAPARRNAMIHALDAALRGFQQV